MFIEYLLFLSKRLKSQKAKSRKLKCCCFATLKPAATCRCLTQSLIKPNRNRIFLFLHFCFPPLIFLHTTTKYKTFWRISGLNNTHFSWGETVKLLTVLLYFYSQNFHHSSSMMTYWKITWFTFQLSQSSLVTRKCLKHFILQD